MSNKYEVEQYLKKSEEIMNSLIYSMMKDQSLIELLNIDEEQRGQMKAVHDIWMTSKRYCLAMAEKADETEKKLDKIVEKLEKLDKLDEIEKKLDKLDKKSDK